MSLGDTPYVFKGGQEDLKRLFRSDPNKAFAKEITLPPGMGVVKGGTILARISESTNRVGYHIPYAPFDSAGMEAGLPFGWGWAYLTSDPGTGTMGYVTMADSYKFAVGDHAVGCDSDQSPTDLGPITAIDRTSFSHIAAISVTNAFGSQTIAKGVAIAIQSKTTAPYVQARGVLMAAVDTGIGENAKGGLGAMVIKNAMFYKSGLYNYNADVLADLSWAVEDDPFLII